jgi:RluA family pseudouridine synthase
VPEPVDTSPRPEPIPLQIIFEDEHMLVLDKPAGLVVHPGPGHATGTLVNALLAHVGPSLEGVGTGSGRALEGAEAEETEAETEAEAQTDSEVIDYDHEHEHENSSTEALEAGSGHEDAAPEVGDRWGIVHRLDALTSGLMMAAKTQPAFDALVIAMGERRVHRQYLGLVAGYFKDDEGSIDRPIGRRKSNRKRMGVPREGGRVALTDWRVLYQDRGLALLALTLHTGRTHQIRVHMQSIGRPILGDPEYGWTRRRTLQDLPAESRALLAGVWPARQMLHATRLGLMHPLISACTLAFRSDPPADMAAVMDAFWGGVWRVKIEQWHAEAVPPCAGSPIP